MVNINFNLKKSKLDGDRPINMVIRWNNKKIVYSTMEKINPRYFETEKGKRYFQRAKSTYPGFTELNARLQYLETVVRTTFLRILNETSKPPNPEELKHQLDVKIRDKKDVSKFTFMEFMSDHIKECEQNQFKDGRKISGGTIRIYKNTYEKLKEFESAYRRRVDFDNIDLAFYEDWIKFLTRGQNLSINTVGRYVKTLKVFLNRATDLNLNTNLAFRSKRFKVVGESVYKIYLSEKELIEMYELDLSKQKRLERVRDLFLVSAWSGLRYTDLVNLKKENIKGNTITLVTQKTGEKVVIPLHWMVKEIMKKYKDYPDMLPRSISNTKFNKYIKDVAKLVPSLQETIQATYTKGGEVITENKPKWKYTTCHSARRSFATNLYLEGLSSLTIMKLTSHKSEKVFLSYLKASPEENAKLLERHWKNKELVMNESQVKGDY